MTGSRESIVSKSIAVFGAGPGLGQAVAHRYAREGYDVVLVARRREPLEQLAKDLASGAGMVHVISADLSDTASVRCLTSWRSSSRTCSNRATAPSSPRKAPAPFEASRT